MFLLLLANEQYVRDRNFTWQFFGFFLFKTEVESGQENTDRISVPDQNIVINLTPQKVNKV